VKANKACVFTPKWTFFSFAYPTAAQEACGGWVLWGNPFPRQSLAGAISPFCVLGYRSQLATFSQSNSSGSMGENNTSTDNYKTVWQVPQWKQAQCYKSAEEGAVACLTW
jgi:hypothetical protein